MTTYTVPTSIDYTGAMDVSAALLSFIASCSDGSSGSPNTIQFQPAGTYRVDSTLALTSRNNLVFDANGSTLQAVTIGNRTRAMWRATTCTGLRFTNGTIVGPNTFAGLSNNAYNVLYEAQHAFDLLGGANLTVDHWTVRNIWGDFVYCGNPSGVLVENNTFTSNGRQGFSVTSGSDIEIRYNTTGQVRRSVIDIEPNQAAATVDNVWVHHNTFGQQRLTFLAGGGAAGMCSNVTVEDNTTVSPMLVVVEPAANNVRVNWTIRRNVATERYGSVSPFAVKLVWVTNPVVTGNTQPMQAGRDIPMNFCRVTECSGYTVSGNSFPGGVSELVALSSTPASVPGAATVPVKVRAVASQIKARSTSVRLGRRSAVRVRGR